MIDGQISQYARMSGLKRHARERPYESTGQSQAAYQQREQYSAMRHPKYRYGVAPLDGKSNRDSSYYQMHDIPKNMGKTNGIHPNLNYVSANLNREGNASYNQFYSNSHQKSAVSHQMSANYHSPRIERQIQQYPGNIEYGENSHS